MRFEVPLVRGTLLRRYKRFLSDITLEDGATVTAHCANSGSMLGLAVPGAEVWLSPAANPNRKLAWDWELERNGGGLVGINTNRPNALVAEAIADGRIPELAGYERLRREVRYGRNSRIDLLLSSDGAAECYVEVKNVHLKRGSAAEFPDAVTARGRKHLLELAEMVRQGARAVMFFLVQRGDCDHFTVAEDIDPAYASALRAAIAAGVDVVCYDCRIDLEGIEVASPLPVSL